MLYRPGTQEVWKGVGYDWCIVEPEEVEELQGQGWLLHPDELLIITPEPEPEPEPEPAKKPATRKKAVTNEPEHKE